VPQLRHTAAAFSAPHCDEDTQLAVALTVTEACTNVVLHAYPDGRGDLDMRAWLEGADLVFEIADSGVWLDDSPSETLGTGLVVMRRLADVRIVSNDHGTRVELRFPRHPQRT
jgi:two-component sensor histidine kinase